MSCFEGVRGYISLCVRVHACVYTSSNSGKRYIGKRTMFCHMCGCLVVIFPGVTYCQYCQFCGNYQNSGNLSITINISGNIKSTGMVIQAVKYSDFQQFDTW